MGTISASGLFSGIDTESIISQLLAIEARPRTLAQRRLAQIQLQQSALLDINSRLNTLKTAAGTFHVNKLFDAKKATSSDASVLSATASSTAIPGTYSFQVERLVSNHQLLSRGFADRDSSAVGATSFVFESAKGRLDRDTRLADLNDGDGIDRGKFIIRDSDGNSATIDLSKALTVNDVLDAINGNSGVDVAATVADGAFVITHNDSGKTITIEDSAGYTTATSLGIVEASGANSVTGSTVYRLHGFTNLGALNDGNGVEVGNAIGESVFDFTIDVDGTDVFVNLGDVYELVDDELELTEARVSTVQGAIDRINTALDDAGLTTITASIDDASGALKITDSNGTAVISVDDKTSGSEYTQATALHLGLRGKSGTGSVTGDRVLAGLNTTLLRTANGGSGVDGDGTIEIIDRDGNTFNFTLDLAGTVEDLIAQVEAETGGNVTARLSDVGTGLVLVDNTGGSGNFQVYGGDTPDSLGWSTSLGGVAASEIDGGSLQHQYISRATLLESLDNGRGVGTGTFRIVDADGGAAVIDIASDTKTIGDLIDEINGAGLTAKARINANGDGIEIYDSTGTGANAILVEDDTGRVAAALRIEGTGEGTGADNVIDGSFETEVEFDTDDTLEDVVKKINDAGAGVSATILNDGAGSNPYRISLASRATGSAGRITVDTNGFDLGVKTLNDGQDALVFYGSDDPADAVLLASTTNTLDNVIQGVSIDLNSTSDELVNLTIAEDTGKVENAVDSFVKAFNDLIDRIDFQTRYVVESEERGALLGDGTVISLRNSLFSKLQGKGQGISGEFRTLLDVGVEIGEGGAVSFDKEKFRQALASDPQGVEDMFAAYTLASNQDEEVAPGVTVSNPDAPTTFERIGIAGLIEEFAKSYVNSIDGVLTLKNRGYETQIASQQDRIDFLTEQLERKRESLSARFIAMERAIAQLQTQQSALSSISLIG